MDIVRLYRDFGIPYMTEGHKHCRPGWANTACPFCTGNSGLHLGFDLSNNYYVCWRCGGHSIIKTIAALLHQSEQQVKTIIPLYGISAKKEYVNKHIPRIKAHKIPTNSLPLTSSHLKYLYERGFDAKELERKWGLLGTGPISTLDKLSYKYRIIIPFVWDNVQVSFDSRDITGKQQNKYQACPAERELIGHKRILYGNQSAWGDTGICVEGPTDVWRFGEKSFATSGIKYTPQQLRLMATQFKRIAVAYDDDPQAVIQAKKLIGDLRFRGVDAFFIPIEGDPGSMSQEDANYLVKQIIK